MKDRHDLDSLPCTVSVVTPKAMCPVHRDAKHTKTSELGAEEDLLKTQQGEWALVPKDPGRLLNDFREEFLKAAFGLEGGMTFS